MLKENEDLTHESAHVAPLQISKPKSRVVCDDSHIIRLSPLRTVSRSASAHHDSQMTPPATPNGIDEGVAQLELAQPTFHNFLRAFYPFHPEAAVSECTVTLPLNEGDVILVHSIHTNGWADGTVLVSGARGWLPTNYCEAYDQEPMRNLLKALLTFWDLLRGLTATTEIFGNQEFMRGIIAGVRSLLVSAPSEAHGACAR